MEQHLSNHQPRNVTHSRSRLTCRTCPPPSDAYSTSRTCEMSLSNHSGINFRGLVYLIDEATKAKAPAAASR